MGARRRFDPLAASLLAAVCLATAACSGLTAPAQAAWPGGDGAIAFSFAGDHGRASPDIWIQKPSGQRRQLTSARRGNDIEPTYSRGGRQIAFSRYSGGDFDIWAMNADGSNKHPVTTTNGRVSEEEPAFLPGGRRLLFTRRKITGGARVYSVGTDGTRPRLEVRHARSPVVSPDGRWLAYWRHPHDGRIRLRNLHTGEERQLFAGDAWELDFSPDGRQLVFVGQERCGKHLRRVLRTIGVHDRHPRMLLDTCHLGFIAYSPAWAPQGNRIVFTRLSRPDLTQVPTAIRLQMVSLSGNLVPGAPHHRGGAYEFWPSWQPLR